MATYKEIKGVTVQALDDDPVLNVGSWSSGGALNTARYGAAGAGNQTDALISGGNNGSSEVAIVENYNGTSWTEVNDLNLARRELAGAGTDTAAIAFGGIAPPISAGGAVKKD